MNPPRASLAVGPRPIYTLHQGRRDAAGWVYVGMKASSFESALLVLGGYMLGCKQRNSSNERFVFHVHLICLHASTTNLLPTAGPIDLLLEPMVSGYVVTILYEGVPFL